MADRRNLEVPDTDTRVMLGSVATREAWEAHRAQVRRRILSASGLDPMPDRTPLNPERFGRLERDGYTVEKVLLESWPGFYLGGIRRAGQHGLGVHAGRLVLRER